MKKNTQYLLAFGIGVITGGAIGYYINSDEGRYQRRKSAKAARKSAKKATAQMNEIAEQATTTIAELVEQVHKYVSEATDSVKAQLDKVESLKAS